MKTVVGLFSSVAAAANAAGSLENLGIPRADISVIAGDDSRRREEYLEKANQAYSAAASAETGASIGAGVGLVAGLVALVIPGVGPIIAGGALATLLATAAVGAAGGGVLAALHEIGVPHEDAPLYEEAVRRGEILLLAHVKDPQEADALAAMSEHGARDLRDLADTWRLEGWHGPKVNPHPWVFDSTIRNHEPPEADESPVKPASAD